MSAAGSATPPPDDARDDDVVVARVEPRRDHALAVRHRGRQHGRAARGGRRGHAGKAVGAGREALQKVFHRGRRVGVGQAVEDKGVAHLHQGLDRAVLGDGDGEGEGLERGLGDPGRDHRARGAAAAARGGDHVQTPRHPGQRLGDIVRHRRFDAGGGLFAGERLGEVGARLLKPHVVRVARRVLDAQRVEDGGGAGVDEGGDEDVDGFVVAAVRLGDEHARAALDG